MSGHHNLTIYTTNDNPWCQKCRHGEAVTSANIFKEGGWLCWSKKGNPTESGCPGFKKTKEQKNKFKPSVGCRCRIKSEHWSQHNGKECILVEQDGNEFSFIPLSDHPEMVMDGSVYYDQCAWLDEHDLEVVDANFTKNVPFIAWVQESEDKFCPDCLEFVDEEENDEGCRVCPKCGCEF